jgi:hypothetical protein
MAAEKPFVCDERLVFQAFMASVGTAYSSCLSARLYAEALHVAGQKRCEDAYPRACCGVVSGESLTQRLAVNLVNANERRV